MRLISERELSSPMRPLGFCSTLRRCKRLFFCCFQSFFGVVFRLLLILFWFSCCVRTGWHSKARRAEWKHPSGQLYLPIGLQASSFVKLVSAALVSCLCVKLSQLRDTVNVNMNMCIQNDDAPIVESFCFYKPFYSVL